MESLPSDQGWRTSPLWLIPPMVTLAIALPVLRHAAKLDRYWYDDQELRVRQHAGLFLGYALAVATPAVVAALASRRARAFGIVATVVTLLMGGVCEAWVSFTTWH